MNYKSLMTFEPFVRKVVVHHLNGLGLGGTEKMVQILLTYLAKYDPKYDHYLAHKDSEDKERLPYFKDALTSKKIITYKSESDFIRRIKELKPHVLHRYSAGIPEWPFVPQVKKHVKHFVSTAVFADQDNTIDISKVIYVSQHLKVRVGFADDPNHIVLRNSVESPYSKNNLRKELVIPTDAFVFGRIGRDDESIYDPINIEAFSKVANNNSYFVFVNPSSSSRLDIERLGITNTRFIERTSSEVRLSEFYNTIDVLAHSRKDGECNPANVWEAAAHGKPVISHYGQVYNGHIETIQDSGFCVLPNDVDEYARIMKSFIDKEIDYDYFSTMAKRNWQNVCTPTIIGNKYIKILDTLV
jgi:glycosyltransferase involved in cell wall biosynthesis